MAVFQLSKKACGWHIHNPTNMVPRQLNSKLGRTHLNSAWNQLFPSRSLGKWCILRKRGKTSLAQPNWRRGNRTVFLQACVVSYVMQRRKAKWRHGRHTQSSIAPLHPDIKLLFKEEERCTPSWSPVGGIHNPFFFLSQGSNESVFPTGSWPIMPQSRCGHSYCWYAGKTPFTHICMYTQNFAIAGMLFYKSALTPVVSLAPPRWRGVGLADEEGWGGVKMIAPAVNSLKA